MKVWIVIIVLVVAGWWFFQRSSPVSYGPGVMAPSPPQQGTISNGPPITQGDYTIIPKAGFYVEAKVLARKKYRFGKEADLSPVDFVLGWGPMSDESVLEKIEIFQSRRWYRWTSRDLPIEEREVESHSANMHMIPANDEVADLMNQVRTGHIVVIDGYLVRVEGRNDWSWDSSMTRDDSGKGACEVVYVNTIEIQKVEEN